MRKLKIIFALIGYFLCTNLILGKDSVRLVFSSEHPQGEFLDEKMYLLKLDDFIKTELKKDRLERMCVFLDENGIVDYAFLSGENVPTVSQNGFYGINYTGDITGEIEIAIGLTSHGNEVKRPVGAIYAQLDVADADYSEIEDRRLGIVAGGGIGDIWFYLVIPDFAWEK